MLGNLEQAACGQIFQTSLSLLSPSGNFLHLASFWWVVSSLHLGSVQDLETCGHISRVFEIQMLWSKLSSELRLNRPSFSTNRRTQLPAQLLRYFELQLYVLARISGLSLFHAREKKNNNNKRKTVYWFHVSYPTTKEVHFLVYSWGKKVLHGDISSD